MNYYYELDTRTKRYNEQQWQWWCQPNCSPAEGGHMDFKLHDDMLANSTRVWLENANQVYLVKPIYRRNYVDTREFTMIKLKSKNLHRYYDQV